MENEIKPFPPSKLEELAAGAEKLVRQCANIQPKEKVLVITDPGRDLSVAYAIMTAALAVGAEAAVVTMRRRSFPGEEPPAHVRGAMLESDVIFQPTSTIMLYNQAARDAIARGARFLAMTMITPQVLRSPVLLEVEFEKHLPLVQKLTKCLTEAKRAAISTPAGTHLEMSLEGRSAVSNPGMVRSPGDFSGTPNIESYIAPVEKSVNGIAVVDGTITTTGLVDSSVTLHITNGIAEKIEGGKHAEILRDLLERQKDRSVYQVAELGIGLNPGARLSGAIIEDEGALGTVHIALGDNSRFGGTNKSALHIDFVQKDPTIELDGRVIIKGREVFL